MKIALLLSCMINILLIGAVYILLNNQASSWLRLDPIQKLLPSVLETNTGSMQHTPSLAPLSRLQSTQRSAVQETREQSLDAQIIDDQGFAALLSLAEEGKWQTLAPQLTEYLYQYPEHVQAQLLEGRVIIHTQTSAAGLEYLYTLLHKLNAPQDIELVASYINEHAQPIIDALTDNQDWTALATFVEPLIQYESQAVTYIEPLALAYAMLNLPDAMENTLASLPNGHQLIQQTRRLWSEQFAITPDYARTQRQPIAPNNQARQADITVALSQREGQWFSPFNVGSEHFELLLDTGASTTAISGDAFLRIPKRHRTFLGRILINTASGQAQARLYNVTNVAIGPWKIAQIDILVLPVERLSGFDGLLGMNVLNRSQVVIDQVSGALEVRLPELLRSQRND
ncbi:MAG: retropepsin-like aspartic protease [Glaciecola sp.]|nr:retropepsin-like aspartic protease [Glaciecola sp.]MDG1468184.1 retropepsin-like aspartic protease [Glaciecola sp.]MDG1921584.1 retropepsin-like aspartic protease [Glaciecola sp.]